MRNQTYRDKERQIAEEAAEWLAVLEDAGAEEQAAFAEWISESPQHLKEFLFMSALDSELTKLDPERRMKVEEIVARASSTVVPLSTMGADGSFVIGGDESNGSGANLVAPGASGGATPALVGTGNAQASAMDTHAAELDTQFSRNRPQTSRRRRGLTASLAAACAAIAVTFGWLLLGDEHIYATAVGEQRAVSLPDGSVMQLNTKSRVRIEYSDNARNLHLLEGEAMFKVERDANRPFRVHSGASVIQAIGTQFNVVRRPSGTTVSVIEGIVSLTAAANVKAFDGSAPVLPSSGASPTSSSGNGGGNHSGISSSDTTALSSAPPGSVRLVAGQEARVGRDGRIDRQGEIDPLTTAMWRQHRLVFRDDTLEDIAAEFNRYNISLQIRIEDEEVKLQRYTAVFDANDPESLVAFLREAPELTLERQGNALVIKRR